MLRGQSVTSQIVFRIIVHGVPHDTALQQTLAVKLLNLLAAEVLQAFLSKTGADICMQQMWCLRLHKP